MFTSSETRQRRAYVENAIAETAEVLAHPHVDEDLGPTNVDAQLRLLGSMYVPNFRHGVVEVPRRYRDTDATPVIAAYADETIIAGKGLGLSPLQQGRALRQIKGWKYTGGSESDLGRIVQDIHHSTENKVGQRLLTVPSKIAGFAVGVSTVHPFNSAYFANIGKSTDRTIIGRPIIGLVMSPENDDRALRVPFTLTHEIVHAWQFLMYPVMPDLANDKYSDDKLRNELEAYGIAAVTERALYNSDHPIYGGNDSILMNAGVDTIRQDHATAKDPFAPRGVIRQVLLNAGMDF